MKKLVAKITSLLKWLLYIVSFLLGLLTNSAI